MVLTQVVLNTALGVVVVEHNQPEEQVARFHLLVLMLLLDQLLLVVAAQLVLMVVGQISLAAVAVVAVISVAVVVLAEMIMVGVPELVLAAVVVHHLRTPVMQVA
jgi:hypothetical protein